MGNNKTSSYFACNCECGNYKRLSYKRWGITRSCGCLKEEQDIINHSLGPKSLKRKKGQINNQWEAVEIDHIKENDKGTTEYWKCKCLCCGEERVIPASGISFYLCNKRRQADNVLLKKAEKEQPIIPYTSRGEDLTGNIYGKLTVLGLSFVAADRKEFWKCQCECGNTKLVAKVFLNNGRTTSCGCAYSNTEAYIKRIFNINNIKYDPQCTFEGCVDRIKLQFDFKVFYPNSNKFFILEYQGAQHYLPIKYNPKWTDEEAEKRLKDNQRHDEIKRIYCEENNIDLLEISYLERKNLLNILSDKLGIELKEQEKEVCNING